jgi:hypothetical protein
MGRIGGVPDRRQPSQLHDAGEWAANPVERLIRYPFDIEHEHPKRHERLHERERTIPGITATLPDQLHGCVLRLWLANVLCTTPKITLAPITLRMLFHVPHLPADDPAPHMGFMPLRRTATQ